MARRPVDGSGGAGGSTAGIIVRAPRRTDHKARTRERILEAASGLVLEVGTEGMSVADVMSRAGLTHGGFYAHFDSKDALVCETVSRLVRTYLEGLVDSVGDLRAEDAAATIVDRCLPCSRGSDVPGGSPLLVLVSQGAGLPPAAADTLGAGLEVLGRLLASKLRIAGMVDAERIASATIARMVGVSALLRSLGPERMPSIVVAGVREAIFADIASS